MEIELWHVGTALFVVWAGWISWATVENKRDIAVFIKSDQHRDDQLEAINDALTRVSSDVNELRKEVKEDIKEINKKFDEGFKELLLMLNK